MIFILSYLSLNFLPVREEDEAGGCEWVLSLPPYTASLPPLHLLMNLFALLPSKFDPCPSIRFLLSFLVLSKEPLLFFKLIVFVENLLVSPFPWLSVLSNKVNLLSGNHNCDSIDVTVVVGFVTVNNMCVTAATVSCWAPPTYRNERRCVRDNLK